MVFSGIDGAHGCPSILERLIVIVLKFFWSASSRKVVALEFLALSPHKSPLGPLPRELNVDLLLARSIGRIKGHGFV